MGHVTVVGGCRAKAPLIAGGLPIGSVVKLMEGGTAVEYLVVNHGIPSNSSLYDASCDGTWLMRKSCSAHVWNDTYKNDYSSSLMNKWLNADFFNSFGSIEQNTIKQVKIPYNTNATYPIIGGEYGVSCKVFITGGREVGFQTQDISDDGAVLDYFAGTSETDIKRKAYYEGTAAYWYLRTVVNGGSEYVNAWGVTTAGSLNKSSVVNSHAIRPTLIIPNTAIFDRNTLLLKAVV